MRDKWENKFISIEVNFRKEMVFNSETYFINLLLIKYSQDLKKPP